MITEAKILEELCTGGIKLPPVVVRCVEREIRSKPDTGIDALIEVGLGKQKVRFAVQAKAQSTPKAFQSAVNQLRSLKLPAGTLPMVVVPYLNESQLNQLEKEQISGLDLCGNGIVIVPDRLFILRSGAKNRFPSYSVIRNVYRRNSSMVGRVFLARSVYKAVQEIREEVNRRNLLVKRLDAKPMSMATVSKVLKTMEEDLLVSRDGGIRLLQADSLLEKLSQNYAKPGDQKSIRLKVPVTGSSLEAVLAKYSGELNLPVVATGRSSVGRYAVMQREDVLSAYCPRIEKLAERIGGSQTDRFPNLELLETDEEPLYFDSLERQGFFWASPVQVYLELMTGDKRDQETAEQVRDHILQGVRRKQ